METATFEISELDRVSSAIVVPGTTIVPGVEGTVIVVGRATGQLLVEFSGEDGVPYAELWFDPNDVRIVVDMSAPAATDLVSA